MTFPCQVGLFDKVIHLHVRSIDIIIPYEMLQAKTCVEAYHKNPTGYTIFEEDFLVIIQVFVNYLRNVGYDAAGFIIPQSVVFIPETVE